VADGVGGQRRGGEEATARDPRTAPRGDDLLGLRDGRAVLVVHVERAHVSVAVSARGEGHGADRRRLTLAAYRTLVDRALIVRLGGSA